MHPPVNHSHRFGCFGYIISFCGLILCLYIYGQIKGRQECVELPNGLLLGQATFFSEMIGWDTDLALKFPNGQVIVRGDKRVIFWHDSAIAGTMYTDAAWKEINYIFVKDKGVYFEQSQPDMYQKHYNIHSKHKPTDVGSLAGMNLMAVYIRLYHNQFDRENSDVYRRDWCPTAWFESDMVDRDGALAK